MRKVIFLGDPHVMPSNISESDKMMEHVEKQGLEQGVDTIIILGDLFHTHAILRIEALSFWNKWFNRLTKNFKVISLVGNHDMKNQTNNSSHDNAMLGFNIPNLLIVSTPTQVDGVTFLPYIHDHNDLVSKANSFQGRSLIAHQTFTGAQYDNGFYAKDGVDPSLFNFEQIISGHIHKKSHVGKCFYVGTGKWDSVNAANEDKGFHTAILKDGIFTDFNFISNKNILTSIEKIVINEGEEVPDLQSAKVKYYIELVGTNAWIAKQKKKLKGKAQLKAKPTDRAFKVEKTGEDFKASEYAEIFKFIDGVPKDNVLQYLRGIGCQV
jgi:DNA repair exonuclease SbcCD nuclease subunit